MVLSTIGAQQEAATEETAAAIEQLLDYVTTYPNDGILLRKSDMILVAHSDAVFLNQSRARSRAGAHILHSENEPKPKLFFWSGLQGPKAYLLWGGVCVINIGPQEQISTHAA